MYLNEIVINIKYSVMEKIYMLAFACLMALSLYGQRGNGKIEYNPVLKTDQIIEYLWDAELSDWILKNRIKYDYTYENGETRTETTSDYFTGIPVIRYINSYTAEKILKESLFQSWVSGSWETTRRNLWFSNDEGLTVEAIIQFWQNDTWVNSIRYTDYQYDNRRLLQYTYQTWTNGQWIDSFHDLWNYDDRGNLVLREQIRVNNIPINKFIYLVDVINLRQSLTLFSWISDKWQENYRILYEYNQCGKTTATIFQVYKNGRWINTTRQEYIYALSTEGIKPGERVPVCHNGNTIYVPVNAVEAHLAHGDCLGECRVEKKSERRGLEENMNLKAPFIIYPNPAKEKFTIKFEADDNSDIKRVELTDFYGKLIRSFNVKGSGDLTIYRENLLSGKYYIRLIGREVYSAVVIFE